MGIVKDISGKRFGRLIATNLFGIVSHSAFWKCKCDCGEMAVVDGTLLRRGTTSSCGCLKADSLRDRFSTHRLSNSRTYYSWSNMIQRTTNANNPRFKDWGGRGITVCEDWKHFPNFLRDMGEKPPERYMSIDRIDNNLGYFPGNCRWSTPKQQNSNKGR